MGNKSEDKHIQALMKEAQTQALEMGIVKPCSSIDTFQSADNKEEVDKYKDIFGNFVEIDDKPARRIFPTKTIPLAPGPVREKTSEDQKNFIWLHEYVECYLHSNVALYEAGTFANLNFCYNPTIWSKFEFWSIPHSEKIAVPRHIILHINKTCTPYQLTSRELTPEEIANKVYQTGYCESGQYYMKKSSRPQFYFTASRAPVSCVR